MVIVDTIDPRACFYTNSKTKIHRTSASRWWLVRMDSMGQRACFHAVSKNKKNIELVWGEWYVVGMDWRSCFRAASFNLTERYLLVLINFFLPRVSPTCYLLFFCSVLHLATHGFCVCASCAVWSTIPEHSSWSRHGHRIPQPGSPNLFRWSCCSRVIFPQQDQKENWSADRYHHEDKRENNRFFKPVLTKPLLTVNFVVIVQLDGWSLLNLFV